MAAALGVEFADELAGGTQGAALPLIRSDLHLGYAMVGLLIAVPLVAGSLLELPLGLVAGHGRGRARAVAAGGLAFIASLVAVAEARSALVLMLALVAFFPASGAFVSLTQAALIDAAPGRRQQRMAAWNLAGSAGAVAGPLLLAVVLAAGGGWRSAYLLLAAIAAAALAGAVAAGPARRHRARGESTGGEQAGGEQADQGPDGHGGRGASFREAAGALRDGSTARSLLLLQISDLLLDVLTGYVGLYLVDVAHASPAGAAIGVAVRLGAALAGDALFLAVSRRVSGPAALRFTAGAAVLLYPAFLLVPGLPAKLAVLAALSICTACWYPVLQAGLYASLPGRSGVAVFLGSAAGLAGAAGPLAVGLVAQHAGLGWALGGLAVVPAGMLALARGHRGSPVS